VEIKQGARLGRGRPKKYGRPSRAVTVTLPEDVLEKLGAVNVDLGRAIVTTVERQMTTRAMSVPAAELASYGKRSVIIVTPLKALRRLPGVELVPVADGRCLISLTHPYSLPQLELEVRDALERGDASPSEHEALEAIADILRRARGSRDVGLEQRTIIVVESKHSRASA